MDQKTLRAALVLVGAVFLIEGIVLGWIGFSFNEAIGKQIEQAVLSEEVFEVSAAEQEALLQPFQLVFLVVGAYSSFKAVAGLGLIYLGTKKA